MKKRDSLSLFDPRTLRHWANTASWQAFLHRYAYWLISVLAVSTALSAITHGNAKAWPNIDWMDLFGEGSLALATLMWLHFIHRWRPPGPVTSLLTGGFALLSYGFFLDTLDEVVRLDESWLGTQLESLALPAAIGMITLGLVSLGREQRVFSRQLRRREAHYRNHSDIDPVTDLYSGAYCRDAVASALAEGRPISLCLIDLEDFNSINQRYGFAIGDAVLNRVAHTLVAAAPSLSLVCRYGGDRFAVIIEGHSPLPDLRQRLNILLTEAVGLALLLETGEQPGIGVQAGQLIARQDETAEQLLQRAVADVQSRKRSNTTEAR